MLRVAPRYTGLAMLHFEYLNRCDGILAGITNREEKLAAIHEMQRLLGCTDAELGDRKRALKEKETIDQVLGETRGCDVAVGGDDRSAGDSPATGPDTTGTTHQAPVRARSRRRKKP